MNRLQLSALMLNEITQIKFGHDMAPNVGGVRMAFKKAAGLNKNATHLEVLIALGLTYKENGMEQEFFDRLKKFKVDHLISPETLVTVAQ